MDRKNRAPLPLFALLIALPAFAAQEQAPAQLPGQPDQVPQQTIQANTMAINDLNRQTGFLAADKNRVNEIYKRAAAMVRTRYLQVAQPAIPLGRLLRIPVCGGATGRGVLVPGPVTGHGLVALDQSTYPNFQNCSFVFETYKHDDGAPLDVENQTALFADIRVKISFDPTLRQQLVPSGPGLQGQPIVHWDVELTSEPFVYQSFPNIPPPVSLAPQRPAHKPTWSGKDDLDSLDDQRDFGFDNLGAQGKANRVAIAKRAIEGHEGGVVQLNSVLEDPRPSSPGFDPCGETRPPRVGFLGLNVSNVIEDHCYTYSARIVAFGDQRPDPKYQGQLRIRFQKNPRTGKIIGIRAFAFGGNI